MENNIQIIVGLFVATIFLLFVVYLLKRFSDKIGIFIRDTMKEKQLDGSWKWSKTALTMATAWYAVLYAFFFDLIKNGFNEVAFFAMIAVATGSPLLNAKAKQINPLTNAFKDEPIKEEPK
jgi:hypothetical protein